jgi:tetratricopeptide (TPR) repeat protein
MIRRVFLPLVVALLALAAAHRPADAQRTAADSAWASGDMATAERLYSARLAADSTDQRALHRMALILAWAQKYDESIHLFDRLLAYAPDNREAYVDRARVMAWRGDPAAGVESLNQLLARDPAYLPALQARAQFQSWAGAYDAALATYGQIQRISPEDRTVGYDRARVLGWASRFGAASAVYDSLLRVNPGDQAALLGLAQVLTWSGKADSASAVYRRVLAMHPGDLDAMRGLARASAWGGHLVAAEREWRDVLAQKPDDPAALVGLAQTLRWQGREAAALEAVEHALRVAPTDRDARAELPFARLPFVPRAAPSYTYESDSDGNQIHTATLSGGWRPAPRLDVRGEAYFRQARDVSGDAQAYGGVATLSTQMEPGWTVAGAAGVSASDVSGARVTPVFRASVASPGRYRGNGSLAYSHSAVDGTSLLVRRQVTMEELGLSASFAPADGWSLSAGGGGARYHGRVSGQDNDRWNGQAAISRRVSSLFTLGVGARAFGFKRDLTDGYFDPDFYGLAELRARLNRETKRWALAAEVAPGVQQVRHSGDPSGSFRATGSLARIFAPGRQLGISGAFANSGLTRLSPTDTNSAYRYHAVSVNGSWSF